MYDYNYGYDYGYGSAMGDPSDVLGILGGLAAFAGIISLVAAVAGIIMLISTWKIYTKAGKPGWASIIPIYNIVVLLEIVELPLWYIALFFVPIANIYAMFKIYIALAHRFGKSTGFGIATVFFGIICMPMLAFGKNCIYVGSNTNQIPINNINPIPTPQFTNNNFNNENSTPAGIQMFDQNVNTNINPINQNNSVQQPSFGEPVTTQNNIIPENNNAMSNMMNIQEQVANAQPQNNFVSQNVANNPQPLNNQQTVMPNDSEQGQFVYKPNNNQQPQPEMVQQPTQQNVFVSQNVVNTINPNFQQVNPNNDQNNPMM